LYYNWSVDDAILKYKILPQKVFDSSSNDPKAAFDHKILKEEIKNVIATAVVGGQSPSTQWEASRVDRCPEFVLATLVAPFGCSHLALVMPTYFLPVSGKLQEQLRLHLPISWLSK
jgi:hypothetical protein